MLFLRFVSNGIYYLESTKNLQFESSPSPLEKSQKLDPDSRDGSCKLRCKWEQSVVMIFG